MDNKLQELTRKLYDEGLEKGRQEAETVLGDARAEAERIRREAHGEAERIRRDAQKDADDLHRNTIAELNLAGRQTVDKLKTAIREMITARALGGTVGEAMLDPEFVREVLASAVKNWHGTEESLAAILPEAMRAKLDKKFTKSVGSTGDVELTFSDKVRCGFRLAPRDGGYYVDFTDAAFTSLLSEYLRPKVDEILYNE